MEAFLTWFFIALFVFGASVFTLTKIRRQPPEEDMIPIFFLSVFWPVGIPLLIMVLITVGTYRLAVRLAR